MRRDGVIFLLENSTDYLFILDQTFRRSQVMNPLRVARYGNEAILYLKGVGIYADRIHYPLPDLIILDMATPDGSGLAVLGWIRRQSEFDSVPVIVLVSATQNKFVQEALEKSANVHAMKREAFENIAQMIRSLEPVRERKAGTRTRSSASDLPLNFASLVLKGFS